MKKNSQFRRYFGHEEMVIVDGADDVMPFGESEELVANTGFPASVFIEVESDHRLAEPEPLGKMLEACEAATSYER